MSKYPEELLDKIWDEILSDEPKNQHAWHDLRKNPDDLPSGLDQVLCFNGFEYVTVYAKSPMFNKYLKNEILPIIAWRYIEPFEGDFD